MASSKLLAVGTIISVLLVVWWFASGLTRRLERLEQTLSVVQVMQQQLQRTLITTGHKVGQNHRFKNKPGRHVDARVP
jgi:hypothetical protein